MYRLAKFHSRTGRLGQPLDAPYPVFDLRNIRFRYGATSMIAGKPGSFKSILALNLLSRWVEQGYSALYFSADSDERTVATRIAAIGSDAPYTKVDSDFEVNVYSPYQAALDRLNPVLFEYRAFDDFTDIADRLNAFEAVYTTYPDIVFLDNLINYAPSTDDWGYMRDMTKMLDTLARETKSHICVLHHAGEGYGDAADLVPRKAILGKLTQVPRVVLTTAASGQAIRVCCVKNTNGPQDPEARRPMCFEASDSLRVTDDYRGQM